MLGHKIQNIVSSQKNQQFKERKKEKKIDEFREK